MGSNLSFLDTVNLSDNSQINSGQLLNFLGGIAVDWNNRIISGIWNCNGLNINGSPVLGGSGTNVQVTGSSNLGTANFSGIGGTIVTVSGTFVLISGAGSSGGGGGGTGTNVQVTGSANLVTADFTGIGGTVLTISGNYILVSGVNTGILTGAFYPYSSNPSNYITTSQTGAFYPSFSNPSGFITSAQTGNFASIINLSITGTTLQNEINTLNNWTGASTGIYYPYTGNPSGFITNNQTGTFASTINLSTTGVTLQNEINTLNNLTGSFVTTGNTGNFITTAQTGAFYPSFSNPSGFITTTQTGNFASTINLNSTGAYLFGLINASSAGVSSLNSQSGALTLTGAGNVTVSIGGSTFTISGNTGVYSTFVTTGQTGAFFAANQTGTFYPSFSNPSGFITTGQTGIFVITSQTGNFVTSGQTGLLTGTFATLNNNIFNGTQEILLSNVGLFPSGNNISGGGLFLGNSTLAGFGTGNGIAISPPLYFSGNYYATGNNFTGNVPMVWRIYMTGTTGILGAINIPSQLNFDMSTNGGAFVKGLILSYANNGGVPNIQTNFLTAGSTIYCNNFQQSAVNAPIIFTSAGGNPTTTNASTFIFNTPYTNIANDSGNVFPINFTGNFASNNGSVNYNFVSITPNYNFVGVQSGIIYDLRVNSTSVQLSGAKHFLFDISNSGSSNLCVLSTGTSGYVGINNNSPNYNLDVSGSGNFSLGLNVAGNQVVTANQTGNFASTINLSTTGITLQNEINTLNNLTGGFVLTGNTGIFITTGQTGAFGGGGNTGILTGAFYPLNSNPAGYLTSVAGGGSILQVTGSSALGTGDFTGIGGTVLSLSGNYVLVSGGILGVQTISGDGNNGLIINNTNLTGSLATQQFVIDAIPNISTLFYKSGNDATVASYYGLVSESLNTTIPASLFTSLTTANGSVLLTGFITPTGEPGLLQIPAGLWLFNLYGSTSLLTSPSYLINTISSYGTTGLITPLFSGTGNILSSSTSLINFYYTSTGVNLNSGDRILSQIYAATNNALSTTITFNYQGASSPSHISTPLDYGYDYYSTQFVLQSQTGSFYPSFSNPSGFITTTQTGDFASTINLSTTGNTLQLEINTLNNLSGGFVLTGNTGNFITTSQTGSFYPSFSNPSGFVTTGQTGAFGGGSFNTGTLSGTFALLTGTNLFSGLQEIFLGGITTLSTSGNNISGVGIILGNPSLAGVGTGNGVELSPALIFSGNFYATGTNNTGSFPMICRIYITGTSGILMGNNTNTPQLNFDFSTGINGNFINGFFLYNNGNNPYINATINGGLTCNNAGITALGGASYLSPLNTNQITAVNNNPISFYPQNNPNTLTTATALFSPLTINPIVINSGLVPAHIFSGNYASAGGNGNFTNTLIAPSYNLGGTQTGTGYDLRINSTTVSLAGLTHYLFDVSNSGRSYFNVTSSGLINATSGNFSGQLTVSGNSVITTNQTGAFNTTYILGSGTGSLFAGTGIILSGIGTTGLAVTTYFGYQFLSGLQQDTTIASANAYTNIISGNVGPGTWMVFCEIGARSVGTTSNLTAKVWSGNGAFFAQEFNIPFSGTTTTTSGFSSASLNGIITTTQTSTPIALSCASQTITPAPIIMSAPRYNAVGIPSGTSTYLQMVRLY